MNLYIHMQKNILPKNSKNVPFIAMGHLSCSESPKNTTKGTRRYRPKNNLFGRNPTPNIFPKTYDHVALGHFHYCRSLGEEKIWYSGTPHNNM